MVMRRPVLRITVTLGSTYPNFSSITEEGLKQHFKFYYADDHGVIEVWEINSSHGIPPQVDPRNPPEIQVSFFLAEGNEDTDGYKPEDILVSYMGGPTKPLTSLLPL
jgi:hypothetical protein